MNSCIVSGTFDPITIGHVDIIKRAAEIFGKVFVCVAKTSGKANSVLTYEDKVEIIRDSIGRNSPPMSVDYEIQPIENTLIDTAKRLGVTVVVRGLRNATDLIYEMDMSSVNRDLDPEIRTLYLPCRPELSYVSSSMVRMLCKLNKYQEAKKYCSPLAVDKIHRKQMNLVGLTGGIACGKSEVQTVFEKNGWFGIDLDKVSEEILFENAVDVIAMMNSKIYRFNPQLRFCITDTRKEFKKKLAELVFTNSEAKSMLEAFMHPLITSKMKSLIFDSNSDNIIVQAPLLFETKMEKIFDKIICVTSAEADQIDRLTRLRRLTEDEAKARIASQMSLGEKEARSDIVLQNSLDIERLKSEASRIATTLKNADKTA